MPRSGSETSRANVSSDGSDHEIAPVTFYVGSLGGLNPNSDPYGLSQRWKRWEGAFNLYVSRKEVTPSFWHSAGIDAQKIDFMLAVV